MAISLSTPDVVGASPIPFGLKIYHRGRRSMPIGELLYLQSEGNYTWLVWRDGQRMLMPRTLKYYEAQLPDGLFVRLHRNCLVNKTHITSLKYIEQQLEAQLINGTTIPVSRRRQVWAKRMLRPLFITHHHGPAR